MFKRQQEKLEDRISSNSLRKLSLNDLKIDFFSNDYLGLSKANFKIKNHYGSTGSRLLTGNSIIAEKTENILSTYFESESALVFNSGYNANLSVLGSIPQRGDFILYDELIHASIRDGIRLSYAKAAHFKHNDTNDLERLLQKTNANHIYVVTEGLYSMDGDICPLNSIVKLTKKYNACLILDEAHSAGVFGLEGRGLAHGMDIHNEIPIRIVTFGKAFGFHGAVVLTNKILKSFLINFARPFIYTTAPSQDFYERIIQIFSTDIIGVQQTKLHKNIRWFRKNIELANQSEENSPIQVVLRPLKALETMSKMASENNIFLKPIHHPTVPIGKERLRICIHSFNNFSELNTLKRILEL